MALLKRKKRTKAQAPPADSHILPERPGPSLKDLKAFNEKFAVSRLDARKRLEERRLVIWGEPSKITPEERGAARREAEIGRRKIDRILSTERNSPRGRKADPVYDKAAYQVRVARIRGKKVSVGDLTRQLLSSDKSADEDKLDKMKQAIKRRR